jgi:hypothetical protein
MNVSNVLEPLPLDPNIPREWLEEFEAAARRPLALG